jgi:hypothetical protein
MNVTWTNSNRLPKGAMLKTTLSLLLATALCSFSFAQQGRILKNGPIAIHLNADTCVAIRGRPKVNYLDEKLKSKPQDEMELTDEQIDFLAYNTDITRSVPAEHCTSSNRQVTS